MRLALFMEGADQFRLLVLNGFRDGITLSGPAEASSSSEHAFSAAVLDAVPESTEERLQQFAVDAAKVGGLTFTVGAVWWVLRLSGVFTALLGSLPAWWQVDPLLVVGDDEDQRKKRSKARPPRGGLDKEREAAREERAVRDMLSEG